MPTETSTHQLLRSPVMTVQSLPEMKHLHSRGSTGAKNGTSHDTHTETQRHRDAEIQSQSQSQSQPHSHTVTDTDTDTDKNTDTDTDRDRDTDTDTDTDTYAVKYTRTHLARTHSRPPHTCTATRAHIAKPILLNPGLVQKDQEHAPTGCGSDQLLSTSTSFNATNSMRSVFPLLLTT